MFNSCDSHNDTRDLPGVQITIPVLQSTQTEWLEPCHVFLWAELDEDSFG